MLAFLGFLFLVAIIGVIVFIATVVIRIIKPFKSFKQKDGYERQARNNSYRETETPTKEFSKDEGEYVNYEEIKEDE